MSPGAHVVKPERSYWGRTLVDWATLVGAIVLSLVAAGGAVLSFDNLRKAAALHVGDVLAPGIPLIVDGIILGSTLLYVVGVRRGRVVPGWRHLAWAGIGATVGLNAAATTTGLVGVPWHIAAPLAWGVILELAAKEALGQYRAETGRTYERIPLRLWLTEPIAMAAVAKHMARTGALSYIAAQYEVSRIEVAVQSLRLTIPGVRAVRVRRQVESYLRRGVLDPTGLLTVTRPQEGEHTDSLGRAQILMRVMELILDAAPARSHKATKTHRAAKDRDRERTDASAGDGTDRALAPPDPERSTERSDTKGEQNGERSARIPGLAARAASAKPFGESPRQTAFEAFAKAMEDGQPMDNQTLSGHLPGVTQSSVRRIAGEFRAKLHALAADLAADSLDRPGPEAPSGDGPAVPEPRLAAVP